MSTKALSVTPLSFEKVFASPATQRTLARRSPRNWTDWREIAWEALQKRSMGDALRRAIGALSAKYREVLFLQDVKNLNTAETAWVLGIPVEAAQSLLLKARAQVRRALSSALFPKPGEKNSHRGNSSAQEFACDFPFSTHQNSPFLA